MDLLIEHTVDDLVHDTFTGALAGRHRQRRRGSDGGCDQHSNGFRWLVGFFAVFRVQAKDG